MPSELKITLPSKSTVKSTTTHTLAVLIALALTWFHYHHQIKHTGPCSVVLSSGETIVFARPNREVFLMDFDASKPPLGQNTVLKDIEYFDWNIEKRHFIKAQF